METDCIYNSLFFRNFAHDLQIEWLIFYYLEACIQNRINYY